MSIQRVSPGVPTGGQFAATVHPESETVLGSEASAGPATRPQVTRADSFHADGRTLSMVTFRDEDGELSDDGATPTLSRYSASGRLMSQNSWQHGVPADRQDGAPFHRAFHPDGSVSFQEWANGDVSANALGRTVHHIDPRNGGAVFTATSFGQRLQTRTRPRQPSERSGSIMYTDAPDCPGFIPQDGPGGEPAVTYFRPDGSVSSTTRYLDGQWTYTTDISRDGKPQVVFTNTEHPQVGQHRDRAMRDVGLDPSDHAGLSVNEGLLGSGDSDSAA